MKKILSNFRFFINSSIGEKKQILFIMTLAFKVILIVKFLPLKRYFSWYFKNDNIAIVDMQPYIDYIDLIQRVLKNLPIKQTCLIESIIVHLFFRRKGIFVPIYLGISTKPHLRAHAWYGKEGQNGFINIFEHKSDEEE